MRFLLFCLAGACLLACAPQARQAPAPALPPLARELYVLLPGNFIVDLAAGDEVWLDPSRHDFILFASPREARQFRDKNVAGDSGQWRVYRLEGESSELAERKSGWLLLRQRAKVADWIME